MLFISGEPGIGKSRLAREFTHWGEGRQQATVLWGYCYEMSGLLPYQPIADAIASHLRMSAINHAFPTAWHAVQDEVRLGVWQSEYEPRAPTAGRIGAKKGKQLESYT